VAGLGERDRVVHRLAVAHLAIRITSGACRSVFLSAICQPSVSTPTSRCVTMQFLCVCTNDRILDGA